MSHIEAGGKQRKNLIRGSGSDTYGVSDIARDEAKNDSKTGVLNH